MHIQNKKHSIKMTCDKAVNTWPKPSEEDVKDVVYFVTGLFAGAAPYQLMQPSTLQLMHSNVSSALCLLRANVCMMLISLPSERHTFDSS